VLEKFLGNSWLWLMEKYSYGVGWVLTVYSLWCRGGQPCLNCMIGGVATNCWRWLFLTCMIVY